MHDEFGTPDLVFNISNEDAIETIKKVKYLLELDTKIDRFIKDVLNYKWQSENKKYYACFVMGRIVEQNEVHFRFKSSIYELQEKILKLSEEEI